MATFLSMSDLSAKDLRRLGISPWETDSTESEEGLASSHTSSRSFFPELFKNKVVFEDTGICQRRLRKILNALNPFFSGAYNFTKLGPTETSISYVIDCGDLNETVLQLFYPKYLMNPRSRSREWAHILRNEKNVIKVLIRDPERKYHVVNIDKVPGKFHLIGVMTSCVLYLRKPLASGIYNAFNGFIKEEELKAVTYLLRKSYNHAAIGPLLGEGSFSKVCSFSYSFEGKIEKRALKLFGEEDEKEKCDLYALNDKHIGGEWFAFLEYGENVLKSYQAIVFDQKTGKYYLLNAREVQELIKTPGKRENVEYLLIGTVAECIEGARDLYSWMKRKDTEEIKQNIHRIAKQLLSAIANLSKEGLIHRDIKLENILITPCGQIKLLDFGFSCAATNEKKELRRRGTRSMMAPEIIRLGIYNNSVDSYSIAATLVNLLVQVKEGSDIKKLAKKAFREDTEFCSLIEDLASWNPARRISPQAALEKYYPEKGEVVAASSSS